MRNVLILGSGRSGTSLLAGTLSQAGYCFGGEPYRPRDANPKGFFETAEVNGTNEVLLASALPRHPRYRAGQRWLASLPENARIESTPPIEERIARLIARTPYCFKDPRFCYTLPVWKPHVGDAAFLCVFREPAVTVASILEECAKEPYLAGLEMTFERALEVWTSMYTRVLRTHAHDGDWHFFHFEQVLEEQGLARIARATGASVARDFPDRSLRRSSSDRSVPPPVRDLYAELCERAQWRAEGRTAVAMTPSWAAGAAPELSVILCTYNRREILTRSLASFAAQTAPPGSFEVVVVDDGSTDGTSQMLDQWTAPVPAQVIHRANGGLAAARNSGIAAARGRILLFVNDDTLAFPDLVPEHMRIHASLGHPSAVLGTFEQPSARLDNALMRFLESANLVFRYAQMQDGETYDYLHFWTCNVSVPADLVRAAGGFDERFRHCGCEDIDLGFRLAELGCRVLFDARARAHHDHVLDLAALERRTRALAKAFVRLFAKHPATLEHSAWAWIREHTIESLDAEVGRRLGRAPALYAAAAELAGTDLGTLEDADAGIASLAPAILAALESTVCELSTTWYFDGFAAGLRELGHAGFAALRPSPPAPATTIAAAAVVDPELCNRPPPQSLATASAPATIAVDVLAPEACSAGVEGPLHDLDEEALRLLEDLSQISAASVPGEAESELARLRGTASEGEIDLATAQAIRLGAVLDRNLATDARGRTADGRGLATDARVQPVLVDLLNDLGVLRYRAGDSTGGLALIGRALVLDPRHELAAKNKSDIERASTRPPRRWAGGADGKAQPTSLNAWTREALDLARSAVGLTGKDVLEVGGAIPPEAARATGARQWSACYLEAQPHGEPGYELVPADARRLPWADATFDVVFSSSAFEHIQDLGVALGEMWRVLRPSGAIVTLFAPIWSYAVGHHLWETDAYGERIMFLDAVIPRFGHLLLTEAELAWYLEIVLGEAAGKRCTHYVYHHPCINRLFESDFRALFERAGFDASHLVRLPVWSQDDVPSDRLAAELARLYPRGGDFSTPGFSGVLSKVMPDARRRRSSETATRNGR